MMDFLLGRYPYANGTRIIEVCFVLFPEAMIVEQEEPGIGPA